MFQVAAGGGFTQTRFADDLIHGEAVCGLVVKQLLYQSQRFLLNAFAAAVLAIIFGLKLVERINVLLVDDFPYPLLLGELDKALRIARLQVSMSLAAVMKMTEQLACTSMGLLMSVMPLPSGR